MAEPRLVVAIVDDEGEVGRALTRLVRSLGHEAEAFTSGPAFLAWLRGFPRRWPNCLLLDIQMPEMSGFEVQHSSPEITPRYAAFHHRLVRRGRDSARRRAGSRPAPQAVQRRAAGRRSPTRYRALIASLNARGTKVQSHCCTESAFLCAHAIPQSANIPGPTVRAAIRMAIW